MLDQMADRLFEHLVTVLIITNIYYDNAPRLAPRSATSTQRLVRSRRPAGRLIGIHSHGDDPGMEIIDGVWPADNPFTSHRHAILRHVKHELGAAARHYNFNASSDARSVFRYLMHPRPDEVNG